MCGPQGCVAGLGSPHMNDTNSGRSSLIETMLADHARFEHFLDLLQRLMTDGNNSKVAKETVEEFDLRLSRHIYAENEVLVPELELSANSTETNAVGAMLQDHDHLRSMSLSLLHMVMREADPADILAAVAQLRNTLRTHTRWEEEEVYPLLTAADPDAHATAIMRGERDDEIFGDPLLD